MSRTTSLAVIALLVCGSLTACQDHAGLTPDPTPDLDAGYTLGIAQSGDSTELVAGMFHLTLDAATLTATATPLRRGQAQPPQNLSYDFDIHQFFTPSSFAIYYVSRTGSGDVQVGFDHVHPFPRTDITLPPSALNRADLGYTGRLVVLARSNPTSVSTAGNVADPTLVKNPDGYIKPGPVLAPRGTFSLTNTYPYVLLADEAKNNRYSLPNGGNVQGNYDPATGGWQRSNLGDNGNGWIGYDYLHQGQAIQQTLTFYKDAVEGGPVELDVAIIIKYTDPRGAGGPIFRLPPEAVDVSQFAYRLPYAALDTSMISFDQAEVRLGATAGSTADVLISIRDWDALATEAATTSLGDVSDVSLVQAGGAGIPVVNLSVPGLGMDPMPVAQVGTHSGEPGDELEYPATLTNTLGTVSGRVWGLVEVIDPEENDSNWSSYHFGVNPNNITQSTSPIERRVYQVLPIFVGGGDRVPAVLQVTPVNFFGSSLQSGTFTIEATNQPQYYKWSFPGTGITPEDYTTTTNTLTVRLDRPGRKLGYVAAGNGYGESPFVAFSFEVLPPYESTFAAPLVVDSALTSANGIAVYDNNGRAWVAVTDSVAHQLVVYRATKNLPTAPSDWVKVIVDDGDALGEPSIAIAGSKPNIMYTGFGSSRAKVAVGDLLLTTSPSDWTTYDLPMVYQHSNLVTTGNRIMCAYLDDTTSFLQIARASAVSPTAVDWSFYQPNAAVEAAPFPPVMDEINGYGRISYVTAIGTIPEVIAADISPRFAPDWYATLARAGGSGFPSIQTRTHDLTGKPVVGFYDPFNLDSRMLHGKISYPGSPGDWSDFGIEEQSAATQLDWLGFAGSRLVGTIRIPSAFYQTFLYVSLSDQPRGPADWHRLTVDPTPGTAYGGSRAFVTTSGGMSRLMVLAAAGEYGFRQTTLEQEWLVPPS